ncbi:hypothetical protein L1987_47625 [Smallanthus sonchifolius]|uniref:Uncharacterized protein n=1 Tax=Smallanthus sonchifolius TaxID=185202 RepID=A0ACB9G4V3_9ASTR|nr:hypothetical protein L1987_47625 [Smallanthus sonchifolius]
MDLKKMETGAARQAQRKSNADIESLHEEYHQRVSALERKVYALMRERDALRREQNKRSDSTALLKEKDEIITQVMAEGRQLYHWCEELSKKQAVQESTIRKLRAQIEENKVENSKKDKAATEKLLQETKDSTKRALYDCIECIQGRKIAS